jgi:hypothetical protein
MLIIGVPPVAEALNFRTGLESYPVSIEFNKISTTYIFPGENVPKALEFMDACSDPLRFANEITDV